MIWLTRQGTILTLMTVGHLSSTTNPSLMRMGHFGSTRKIMKGRSREATCLQIRQNDSTGMRATTHARPEKK